MMDDGGGVKGEGGGMREVGRRRWGEGGGVKD